MSEGVSQHERSRDETEVSLETMSPDAGEGVDVRLQQLETQLAQKEEIVVALTARLEQAAEQLDRIRRTGGHSGPRVGGGIPADLIQEQRELTQELQQALKQWDQMQAGMALGQLQMQVSELRDFVAGRFDDILNSGNLIPSSSPEINSGFGGPAETANDEPDANPSTETANDAISAYEAMKAELLGGNSAGDSGDQNSGTESAASSIPPDDVAVDTPPNIPEVEAPEAIDIANATLQELQAAVETRDAYIGYLIRKMRAVENSTRFAGNWADLENVPDELRARLEEYGQKLQDARKMAEVENSLERARLARESARLALLDQQLQKQMKRMGISNGENPSEESESEGQEPKKKKGSWRKLLGVGNSDEDDD
ncbi:MAG: hypothetical protein Tsb009_26220 [Planctomycetaceae bacterium]